MDRPLNPIGQHSEDGIAARLGIGRKAFGFGWWALALWSATANLNILARAQNWGFHVPPGPGFEEVVSAYGIAAYGSFGGGVLLWIVLLGMLVHGATWGRAALGWPGRIPAAWNDLSDQMNGPVPRILQGTVLVIAVLLPLVLQVLFASKFLGGTATRGAEARVNFGHLWPPPTEACKYTFDGSPSFSYCEFYEPWAVLIVCVVSLVCGFAVLSGVFWPRNPAYRGLWWACRRLAIRVGLGPA